MIKRFLLCLAVASICSQAAFAQTPEVFLSFAQGADARTTLTTTGVAGDTGTAFLFSDREFTFSAIEDLQIGVSTDSAAITAATILNPGISAGFFNFQRWTDDPANPDDDPRARLNNDGTVEFFALNFAGNATGGVDSIGILPSAQAESDPTFDVDANAFLLGTIEFVINDGEETELNFPLNTRVDEDGNTIQLGDILFDTATRSNADNSFFQTAIINPGGSGGVVPEPTSAALLALGFAGLFTRRRR